MNNIIEFIRKIKLGPDVGANDIIGWALVFFGGLIVYKIVDGFQTRIARYGMIREIEN